MRTQRIARYELAAMNPYDRFPASHWRAALRTAVLRGRPAIFWSQGI